MNQERSCSYPELYDDPTACQQPAWLNWAKEHEQLREKVRRFDARTGVEPMSFFQN